MSLCYCFFFFLHWDTRVSLPRLQPCSILTEHFHFTESNPGVFRIPLRIRRMSPAVVVDDVSSVVRTGDVDRIRYRGSSVFGVTKTQHSVLFVCRVGDVDRKSQELPTVPILISRTMIQRTPNIKKKRKKYFNQKEKPTLLPLPDKKKIFIERRN